MNNRKGLTLIETTVSLVVIAIIGYAFMSVFIGSSVRSVDVDVFLVAQSLGEERVEETLAQSYSAVTDEAQTNFSGDLNSYSYTIKVSNVSAEALDTIVGYDSGYKKFWVMINHAQLTGPVTLEALKVN